MNRVQIIAPTKVDSILDKDLSTSRINNLYSIHSMNTSYLHTSHLPTDISTVISRVLNVFLIVVNSCSVNSFSFRKYERIAFTIIDSFMVTCFFESSILTSPSFVSEGMGPVSN